MNLIEIVEKYIRKGEKVTELTYQKYKEMKEKVKK